MNCFVFEEGVRSMKLGGSIVSSVTHSIVFAEGLDEKANELADALRKKFDRAPVCIPEAVWIRSCHLHRQNEADGRPRIHSTLGSWKKQPKQGNVFASSDCSR